MHSADRHKACFEINGRPAINRAIDTYRACGIERHIVVVGALAGQVIETVGRAHEGVIFAYQAEQRGTGHAAKQGARMLADLGYQGAVLVVAGDRLLAPQVVEQLIAQYHNTASDMVFLVGPRGQSELGHVLRGPDGAVLGVVEHRDVVTRKALAHIRRLALDDAPDLGRQALQVMQEALSDPPKAAIAFGDLWRRLTEGELLGAQDILGLAPEARVVFRMGNAADPNFIVPAEQADRSDEANQSVYLVKAQALYDALSQLSDDNAQREEYLPDIINIMAQARQDGRPMYRIGTLKISNPALVMGFNNPAELLEIENALRTREMPHPVPQIDLGTTYRPVHEWQQIVEAAEHNPSQPLACQFNEKLRYIYGDHPELLVERRDAYRKLLRVCAETLGAERPVLLTRAPGRINIMGRHVDHQGGNCNLMAVDREVLVAAALREDDEVHLYNTQPDQFGPRRFSMSELLAELTWDDWLSLVNSDAVRQMVSRNGGDWAQYVRAAFLRLQKSYPDVKIRGLDMVVSGSIPIAAGLSSSSAIVVATAEAIVALNGLDVRPRQFVDLCGEGEWFVGTRGGAADHAAMKFAQRDAVINVGFLPFLVGEANPFPEGYRLVFCNSHIKAQKAAAAREMFNQRVACYHLGVHLIRGLYSRYAPLISHLRDINTRHLPLRLIDIYRMLLKLPERATRADLMALLPEGVLRPLIGPEKASDTTEYPIRGVVLYGLAECERSRRCPEYLRTRDVAGLGKLMRISHAGDRVVQHDNDLRMHPYRGPASNAYLLDLMADLESGEPDRVLAAQLHLQPGSYACSMPELDLMVDIAFRTDGVMGAQLAGAGLGGGVMALVEEDHIAGLEARMIEHYYEPRGLEPAILLCIPTAGSGVIELETHKRH